MKEIQGAGFDWYQKGYRVCYYTGKLGFFYNGVHKLIEKKYSENQKYSTILELGAGNGEHFNFVKCQFDRYVISDIDVSGLQDFTSKSKIEVLEIDCCDLTKIDSESIDRVIATCLLVHVNSPLRALQEWRRVTKDGGIMTFYVALEPAFVLRIIRRFFIWPKSRKNGATNPEILAYSEHKNHYPAMRVYIKEVFKNDYVKRRRYPFMLPWNFAFFEIYEIRKSGS